MDSEVNVILDCFLFSHELDLLEVRLRVLWDSVDKFVLFENNKTHQGESKPFFFNENKERFAWAKDKIHHVMGIDVPPGKDGRDFAYEFSQREELYKEALKIAGPKDIILMSDIDEIPSREIIDEIRIGKHTLPVVLRQDLYYYNINGFRGKKWSGTMAIKAGDRLKNIETTRGKRNEMANLCNHVGWHFSYFMSVPDIQRKLRYFAHANYNDPKYSSEENLKKCMIENKNFLGKPDGDKKPEDLPGYLLKELSRFPAFIGVQ